MYYILLVSVILMLCRRTDSAVANPNSPEFAKPNCTKIVSRCEPMQGLTCFGTSLPYNLTSSELISDQNLQLNGKLQLWQGLQNIPKCWEVVQPLICAVYMPKCITDNVTNTSRVQLPARDLCEKTREPCRIVEKYKGWPDFLKCDHPIYVPGCTNDVMSARFNLTSNCAPPLLATKNAKSWHPDIHNCGIQCQNPIYTDKEHEEVHVFVAVVGSICLFCTLFTIVTFLLEWKVMSRYPGVIVFYINGCFFFGSIGWMAQFIPGARKDIVCRADGTMRKAEPQIGSGENAACTVVFIVVYYFMMAGVSWFVILTYALNLTYGALGSTRDVLEGRRGHFHLVAWCVPLVLTITCLALSHVDGDSLSGICFVGFVDDVYRGGFVLLPIGLSVFIGLTFLVRGLIMLVRIRTQSPGLISDEASARIRDTIIRLGFFSLFLFSFTIVTFSIHAYIFMNGSDWQTSLDEYIACKSNITSYALLPSANPETCRFRARPSVVSVQIHIFTYFATGIIMSTWVWNWPNAKLWKRNLKKLFCMSQIPDGDVDPVDHPKKSDILPNLFVIQKEVHHVRQSSSFNSNRDDPHALNMDLTSVTSRELSSSWAPAVQRMMLCRSGYHSAAGRQRRYSDSDVQSISSLFEHIGLHDAPSKQKHLKTSLDTSTNDPKSSQNLESSVPAPSKSRRQGHSRRKNRVVPAANDYVVAPSVQIKPTDNMDKEGPVGSQHPVVADGIGYASSFPGCSSLSGGSSMMARSSTIGGSSSITGGSSVGCGTSNSFQGSDVRAESAVSESRGVESVDEDTAEIPAHCQDVAYNKTAFNRVAKHNDLNPNVAERADSEHEQVSGLEEYSGDEESEEGEDALLNRSPSNFTVASSDTEALSIKLDVDYQPVESATDDPPQLKAVPPSSNVIKVSPIKPLTGFPRKSLYDLSTSEVTGSDKPIYPSQTTHNSTQTSSFLPAFVSPHSPYSMYGYGPYMPPPPMYCMPNAETPIWPPPIGYPAPAYFYPPYFEPRPYFPFPPSYYSQFTPPPAPYELINQLPRNQGSRADVTPKAQSARNESQSRNTSQQTESSSGSQANFHWNDGKRAATTFRSAAGNKSRDYGCQSLLEMVELMTPQLDSGTEESQDSASTPRRYEIDEKKEESRKSKRRQRRQWLKTLTTEGRNDHSDTSV